MFRIYRELRFFNKILFTEVWIDPHYEEKHGDSITDELILRILDSIDEGPQEPDGQDYGYKYYRMDLKFEEKSYRLILVVPHAESYLGVRNAFRR